MRFPALAFAFAAALAALPAAVLPAAAQPVAPGTRLDGIAAVVGDQVVLYSEVDALATQSATQQQAAVTPALWSRALDQLVERRILIDNARRDTTVTATDAQVSDEVERNVQQLVQQVGSEAALEEAYGRPLASIRESFRDEVRDDLLLQQYRGRRLRDVAVTPGEVAEWFAAIPAADIPEVPELVRVAHVVRSPAPGEASRTAARTFAQALRDSVASGRATLGELADRHSTDPGNRNRDGSTRGGSYENLAVRDLDPPFASAATALQPGGLSEVFEGSYGFHIVRLDARVADRISFSHILIPVAQGGQELVEAQALLVALRDSVASNLAPFEAVARRHSQDPYSASRGGFVSDPRTGERDLRLDALGAAWKATVDTMAVGEISGVAPVQLLDQTNVLHFVLLQRRTPAHRLSLADDYVLLSEYTLQDKRQRVLREWVDSLRRSTYVDIRAADRYVPIAAASPAGAPAGGAGR